MPRAPKDPSPVAVKRKRLREVHVAITPWFEAPKVMRTPEDAAIAFRDFIGDRANECFAVIYLDVRNNIVGYILLTEGAPASVSVHPQGILQEGLLVGAAGLVTAHQHPSGNAQPSAQDFELWARLKEASRSVGMALVDNLVITPTSYYSESMGHASIYGLS